MRIRTTTALAALLVAGLTPLTLTTPASAAPAKYADDFNGDGYRDLAIGAPSATVGGKLNAGAVVVLYGSSSGVSAAKRSVITQNSTGVPGTAEELDGFGSTLTSGDLDEDGYADLVVGAPSESIGDKDGVGTATIIWGGKKGLSGGASVPQPSTLSEWGQYAVGLAAADFDGDGGVDLTITSQQRTRIYKGPWKRTGAPVTHSNIGTVGTTFTVIAGDLSGDGAAERIYPYGQDDDPSGVIEYYRWTGTKYAITDMPTADGSPGAIGDINGDGYGDLVLGQYTDPSKNSPGGHLGGQITVWYGGPTGPDPTQTPTVINQDTAGVPGAGEGSDLFGSVVSVGDVNGDTYADVAVGAMGEDGSKRDTGAVTVLYGSATGLTATGAKTYTQDTAGVPGAGESGDEFGSAVRLVDLDKDGRAELVASATRENNGTGAVWILRGTTKGLTTTSAKSVSGSDVSLGGSPNLGWVISQ